MERTEQARRTSYQEGSFKLEPSSVAGDDADGGDADGALPALRSL